MSVQDETYIEKRTEGKKENLYLRFNHRSPKSACFPAIMLSNMSLTQGLMLRVF